jgi:DNA-binding beta-propeller fold protein YncE
MRAVRVALATVAGVALCACGDGAAPAPGKIYVCAQTAGTIDVLDAATLAPLTSVAAGDQRMPHNVTVTPDRRHVLVTSADVTGERPDELLVLDPTTDAIVARVALDEGAFSAHVVVAPDGGTAYVSGWGSNLVYRVDLGTMTRLGDVTMPGTRRPHGLGLSADGRYLYSANTESHSVSRIDTVAGLVVAEWALPGAAIQVAVADGVVYASVAWPPAVARIDLDLPPEQAVTVWPLPDDARDPAQVALTPDGTRVLVAEQGDADLPGNLVDVLDATTGALLARHETGLGAHGITVAPDGRQAWITAMYEDTVTRIDLHAAGGAGERAAVGRGPNGIALWREPVGDAADDRDQRRRERAGDVIQP